MIRALVLDLLETLIGHVEGPVGNRLRRIYWSRRLAGCGANLRVEAGVAIAGADHITLGDDVWIDRHVTLIAGPPSRHLRITKSYGPAEAPPPGMLAIGSRCHLGVGTIIQAHGGVTIGDAFTSSAGTAIYSLSNDPRECRGGTVPASEPSPGYVRSPVNIGRNVWLGLRVTLLGGEIGDDCFARPNSVIAGTFPPNSILGGDPAVICGTRFATD